MITQGYWSLVGTDPCSSCPIFPSQPSPRPLWSPQGIVPCPAQEPLGTSKSPCHTSGPGSTSWGTQNSSAHTGAAEGWPQEPCRIPWWQVTSPCPLLQGFHQPQPTASTGARAGKGQEGTEPAWGEAGGGLSPLLPSKPTRTAARSYLLMREMQSSAWLRRGELLRLLRLSPSLTRDCSTLLHEAAERGQALVRGGQGQDEEPAAWL